jgi:hypothetical protein
MMSQRFVLSSKAATTASVYRDCTAALILIAFLTCLPGPCAVAQLDVPMVAVAPPLADGSYVVPAKEIDFTLRAVPNVRLGDGLGYSSSVGASLPEETREAPVAPIYAKYIPAGVTAQPITARDKFGIGIRDLYTPFAFGGFFAAAAYGQVLNGQPNYGTDRGAFGARLGAAAIDGTTQGIFVDTLFAPLLHEDPRYYVEGRQYGFIHRTVYAATRPLITRTDSGRRSVNGALLLGYAAATALTWTYYPQSNRNFHDTVATFGGSVGGEALDFVIREFASDVMEKLHLVRQE